MQKSLLCVWTLLFFNVALCKSGGSGGRSVGSTSSYGYSRTSASSTSSGTFLSGRTGGYYAPVYYRSTGCNGANRNCGMRASDSGSGAQGVNATLETEQLMAYHEGSCLSHGCREIVDEIDCKSASDSVQDTTGIGAVTGEEVCPDTSEDNTGSTSNSKCWYVADSNDVRWCSTGSPENKCTTDQECLCWCVVGEEDEGVDVGLILGITFGALFGCCFLLLIWINMCGGFSLKNSKGNGAW